MTEPPVRKSEPPTPLHERRLISTLLLFAWSGLPLLLAPPSWYALIVGPVVVLNHLLFRRLPAAYQVAWSLRRPMDCRGVVTALAATGAYVGAMGWYHRIIAGPMTSTDVWQSILEGIGYSVLAFMLVRFSFQSEQGSDEPAP